jgi:hypothetical protein
MKTKINKLDLIKKSKEVKNLYSPEELEYAIEVMTQNNLIGKRISPSSFLDVLKVMEKNNLAGVPIIDTMTYAGWLVNGYKVKKGEKAFYKSITWVENQDEASKEIYPKVYSLFHRSQVEISKKDEK